MKSTLFSVFLLFLTVVCRAESVSLDGAVAIANKFLSANAATWQVDVKRNPHQLRARSKNGANFLYYVFKGNDNRGFVIVSGDDVARPVLGYSFDAEIPDSETLPPGMQDWLDDMELQIRSAIESGYEPTAAQRREYAKMAVGDNEVQLETAKWDQDDPYNYLCPVFNGEHCLAGCVPVAYAILMKYYGYPTRGRGKTPMYYTKTDSIKVGSRNLDHAYNWDGMPLKFVKGQYTDQEKLKVAYLMADIGAALQADYGVDKTGANLGRDALFTYFDYNPGIVESKDKYSASTWYSKIREELDQNHPVLYQAYNNGKNGHAFVLDGYTYDDYFSINWGWSGKYNGHYTLDALYPGSHKYPTDHAACFGCVPMPLCQDLAMVEMNGEAYPSLKIAVAAAPAGGESSTIKLLADISSDYIAIGQGKDIVLDLNGKELSMNDDIKIEGSLTVSGENGGKVTNDYGNHELFSNYGNLTILSGTFNNPIDPLPGTTNYSRCVWSSAGSSTTIRTGTFSAYGQVLCFNGDATIMDGVYTCHSNNGVVSNYNTSGELRICGGTFVNDAPVPSGTATDYRRGVWTTAGSNTIIEDGSFKSPNQVLCFNGDATIYNAAINNPDWGGYGLLAFSEALVSIKNCKLKAYYPLYAYKGSKIECEGGIYSEWIDEEFIKVGYGCTDNPDADTSNEYPYAVFDIDTIILGVADNCSDKPEGGQSYSITGWPVNNNYQGIVIQNGRKLFRKQ